MHLLKNNNDKYVYEVINNNYNLPIYNSTSVMTWSTCLYNVHCI